MSSKKPLCLTGKSEKNSLHVVSERDLVVDGLQGKSFIFEGLGTSLSVKNGLSCSFVAFVGVGKSGVWGDLVSDGLLASSGTYLMNSGQIKCGRCITRKGICAGMQHSGAHFVLVPDRKDRLFPLKKCVLNRGAFEEEQNGCFVVKNELSFGSNDEALPVEVGKAAICAFPFKSVGRYVFVFVFKGDELPQGELRIFALSSGRMP